MSLIAKHTREENEQRNKNIVSNMNGKSKKRETGHARTTLETKAIVLLTALLSVCLFRRGRLLDDGSVTFLEKSEIPFHTPDTKVDFVQKAGKGCVELLGNSRLLNFRWRKKEKRKVSYKLHDHKHTSSRPCNGRLRHLRTSSIVTERSSIERKASRSLSSW